MGVRSQLGWIRHGAARTGNALAVSAAELHDLQVKVEALTAVVARLDVAVARVDADVAATRALSSGAVDSVDAIKDQLRMVTDDLGDRLGALAARAESAR